MNRRGFMGALAASGLIPFLPKPEAVNVRLTHHKPAFTINELRTADGSIKVDGGAWPSREFYTGNRAEITYTVHVMPDGSTVKVPRLEGARALYHG